MSSNYIFLQLREMVLVMQFFLNKVLKLICKFFIVSDYKSKSSAVQLTSESREKVPSTGKLNEVGGSQLLTVTPLGAMQKSVMIISLFKISKHYLSGQILFSEQHKQKFSYTTLEVNFLLLLV